MHDACACQANSADWLLFNGGLEAFIFEVHAFARKPIRGNVLRALPLSWSLPPPYWWWSNPLLPTIGRSRPTMILPSTVPSIHRNYFIELRYTGAIEVMVDCDLPGETMDLATCGNHLVFHIPRLSGHNVLIPRTFVSLFPTVSCILALIPVCLPMGRLVLSRTNSKQPASRELTGARARIANSLAFEWGDVVTTWLKTIEYEGGIGAPPCVGCQPCSLGSRNFNTQPHSLLA